jgi:hypothetical protein
MTACRANACSGAQAAPTQPPTQPPQQAPNRRTNLAFRASTRLTLGLVCLACTWACQAQPAGVATSGVRQHLPSGRPAPVSGRIGDEPATAAPPAVSTATQVPAPADFHDPGLPATQPAAVQAAAGARLASEAGTREVPAPLPMSGSGAARPAARLPVASGQGAARPALRVRTAAPVASQAKRGHRSLGQLPERTPEHKLADKAGNKAANKSAHKSTSKATHVDRTPGHAKRQKTAGHAHDDAAQAASRPARKRAKGRVHEQLGAEPQAAHKAASKAGQRAGHQAGQQTQQGGSRHVKGTQGTQRDVARRGASLVRPVQTSARQRRARVAVPTATPAATPRRKAKAA